MKYNLSGRIPKVLPLIIAFLTIINGLFSQTAPADTLTLGEAIDSVMKQYPAFLISEEALRAADAKIDLARTGYLPDIDISATYSRIGPVPSFDFPSFGHIQLYPDNNIIANLNYQQNIYDFGKTAGKVKAEQQGKKVAAENVEVVRQQLTKRVVNLYYSILYFQEAIRISDQ
jgi:outer membrane protein